MTVESGLDEADDTGTTPMPSGTVTFLFTDVEGSTELWQRDSDRMGAALATHDARVRAAIEHHGGYIFGLGGDGFFAAFSSTAGALSAARSVQDAMADEQLIRVRLGLHTGEAQTRQGAFFGMEVNRTARIATSGHGGQIVMSAVTAALCPTEDLVELGAFRLRGLDDDIVLWQLGLESFPALRTERATGNISAPINNFIGRTADLGIVEAAVRRNRMVTLIGPGGVGKTRLALQVAGELDREFRDGTWMASLASLTDPSLVASAVADDLRLRVSPTSTAEETLTRWFAGNHVLLVIDNCEHVAADAAALIEHLTDVASASRILTTSQVPTGVRGENLLPVEPLDSGGDEPASRRLFIDRARTLQPDFDPDQSESASIDEICERLDHLPLAIELAASRMRAMTPSEIAARLDERLRFLASRNRRAPDRHKTLDAAVRWSYDLLEELDQTVLRKLSIFVGPFGMDEAQAVLADDDLDEWDILDSVIDLVDRSLVSSAAHDGTTRYHLLESIKAFGLAELAASGDFEAAQSAYAAEYHRLVLELGPALLGPRDRDAVLTVGSEWPHIRAALQVTSDDIDSTRFEEMYAALGPIWNAHARTIEGVQWAEALMRRPVIDPHKRAAALNPAAGVANAHTSGAGQPFADEAIALWQAHDTIPPVAVLANQALDEMLHAHDEEAIATCRSVIAMCSELDAASWNRDFAMANALSVLGTIGGDTEFLREIYGREMARAETIGCSWHETALRAAVSPCAGELVDDPVAFVQESVDRLLAIGNPHSAAHCLEQLAIHNLKAGDTPNAATLQLESIRLTVDHAPGYLTLRISMAVLFSMWSEPERAARLLGYARHANERQGGLGSSGQIRLASMSESVLRKALDTDFEVREDEGRALREAEAVELAVAVLTDVASGER